MYVEESVLLDALGLRFVLGFAYNGEAILTNQVFGQYTFAQAITFPANFAGAEGATLSLPTLNPWTCPIFQRLAAGGAPVQMATMSWTSAASRTSGSRSMESSRTAAPRSTRAS